jgi:hypothetical protein
MAMKKTQGRTLSTRRVLPSNILDLLRTSDGSTHIPLPQNGQVAALKESGASKALLDGSFGQATPLRTIMVDGRKFLVFQLPLA